MNTKLLLLLIPCFLLTLNANAQNHRCGTVTDELSMDILKQNKKRINYSPDMKMDEMFIPVQVHLVGDSQGEKRLDEVTMYQAICTLNKRYEGTNFRFYLNGFSYMDNGLVHNHFSGLTNAGRMAINNAKHPNAANVFMVQDPGEGVGGYYSRGFDAVIMRSTAANDERYTLEHELGHFFSLPHTHRGWDQIATMANPNAGGYDPAIHGDTVTITSVSSSQSGSVEVELMDGSNCDTAGDMICDTPPDYGFGYSCGCCRMIYDVWDRNGDKIEPMIDNVMSYSEGCMPYRFSDGQIEVMHSDLASSRRSYLRNGNVTEYTPITEEAVQLTPDFGDIVENYNGVEFDWEDVAGAEKYILRITGDDRIEFEVTESAAFVTELEPMKDYFWEVYPVNKFGLNCDARAGGVFFTTGNTTTSTDDLNKLDVTVYPNPVASGQQIKVLGNTATKNVITLTDITGKVVHTEKGNGSDVSQTLSVNTATLNSGIYILEIVSADEKYSEKIIIE